MSFKTRLKLGGKEYDVVQCRYSLHRDVDSKGRPSSSVYGGTIHIEVESTEDTSVIESMVNNQYKAFSGSIVFKKGDEDSTMKELKFEDTYIIKYSEGLSISDKSPMTLSFELSSRVMEIQNARLENDWPKA